MERLKEDVAALAAMRRGSASPGERAAAEWAAGRLRELGAGSVSVEAYRGQGTYAWAQLAHLALGLLRSRALALLAAVLLEGEVSGRFPSLRRLLRTCEGANVVARLPAQGASQRVLVLVAHLDTARTGIVWNPALPQLAAPRRLRRRAMDPMVAPLAISLLLSPWRIGRVLLGVGALALLDTAARRPVPGASDNASGVAAVLALAARGRRPETEVWVVLPGAEESGMDGMRAFLAAHADELREREHLVLGLDTLGSGTPAVLTHEGGILPHAYAPEDVALVPDDVERWRLGAWTDPILARFAGLRTISLISRNADGGFSNYHLPSDTPDRVDWDSVEACVDVAERTISAWASTAR